MKVAKSDIKSRKRALPEVKFCEHDLTSFGGLVVFQSFFDEIGIAQKFNRICAPLDRRNKRQYSHGSILLCLVVYLLVGFRRLRDSDYHKNDPMLKATLKLHHLPSVPTMSRMMADFDEPTLENLRHLNTDLILTRLKDENLYFVTIDFDGSIQSTSRYAEGSAVGFNKKKKGERSYYPLFANIAQTGQIFNFLHRSGNIHDYNGAPEFIWDCIELVKSALPKAVIEVRMDSAFFSEELLEILEELKVQYTITVPFERFVELKGFIEERSRWSKGKNGKGLEIGYFEKKWKPKRWDDRRRFIFIRTPTKKQKKGPIVFQEDMFEPADSENKYKVIITNKKNKASHIVAFHEGRGAQERCFGEAKSQVALDYIPCRKKAANEVFLWSSVIAHNLGRELQMKASKERDRKTTPQRSPLWVFDEMNTLRNRFIRTAGRLTRPQGVRTLSLPNSKILVDTIRRFLPQNC